jgi:hypothetical protein
VNLGLSGPFVSLSARVLRSIHDQEDTFCFTPKTDVNTFGNPLRTLKMVAICFYVKLDLEMEQTQRILDNDSRPCLSHQLRTVIIDSDVNPKAKTVQLSFIVSMPN